MAMSIVDHMLPYDTHNLYEVNFFTDSIHTIVTTTPSFVDTSISDNESFHNRCLHRLIVSLDVEWWPSFNRYIEYPVSTLQLCVGRRCLIFQIFYSPYIPQSLIDFLTNPNYTFVGVGFENVIEKLTGDYGLVVANQVDLRQLAAEENGNRHLLNYGLKILAMEVRGKEITKPKNITMSRWDNRWLTSPYVQYACIDAFLSFEIGRSLNAAGQICYKTHIQDINLFEFQF